MKLYEGYGKSDIHTTWQNAPHYPIDGGGLTFCTLNTSDKLYLTYNAYPYNDNNGVSAYWLVCLGVEPIMSDSLVRCFPMAWADHSLYLTWQVVASWPY